MSEPLSQLFSSAYTWALLLTLLVYMLLKDRQMMILVGALFILSLLGDLFYSYLYNHSKAVYLWYVAWGGRALVIMLIALFVSSIYRAKIFICYSVAIFAFISLCLNFIRLIERNYTNTSFFKELYMVGENTTDLLILLLVLPIMPLVNALKMKYKIGKRKEKNIQDGY